MKRGEIVGLVPRDNLTMRVYSQLRKSLMEGQFAPGHRFKIRELALAMGVSETPIREALMQLVCEGALEMQAARSITVTALTLAQYLELRSIRLLLEGLAAERATERMTKQDIRHLESVHRALIAAEQREDGPEAVRANWEFHSTLFVKAEMPELLRILEGIWLRQGPMMNFHYPHAKPTYPGRHQHLNVLEGLRSKDPEKVRRSIQADLTEGGAALASRMEMLELEAGREASPVR